MAFDIPRVIKALEPAPTLSHEPLLRVFLANLAQSLRRRSGNRAGAKVRLKRWLSELPRRTRKGRLHVDDMYAAAALVFDQGRSDAYYLNSGRDLTRHLDDRAVSIVASDALAHWLDLPLSAASPYAIQDLCVTLNDKGYRADAMIGGGGAYWFTPYCDPIKPLVEAAAVLPPFDSDPISTDRYRSIAQRTRNLLGLAHLPAGVSLIAAVSKNTIRQLVSNAATTQETPMAPTVLEGRCHPRWRHWPLRRKTHCYGRAYELNQSDHPRPDPIDAGALEGVRAPLSLHEIERFVFLGPVTSVMCESDEQFAEDLGVHTSVEKLLRRVEKFAAR